MKRAFLLEALIAFVLLLGIAVYAGRLVRLAGPSLRIDLAGRDPATLPPELERLLRGLEGDLDATLFVSARERLPADLKDVEETTGALLWRMAAAGGRRFSFRVIDPDLSGAAGARYAASRRVSPVRVRRVVADAESQAEIWSSLVLARQGRPRRDDVLIQGIQNAHLPHLAQLVTAHLQAGQAPPQAAFAVSAPTGYDELPRFLSQDGPVIDVDVDGTGQIPDDVDVLYWIEPRQVTARHIAALRRFLASGRSAVLAGSCFAIRYSDDGHGGVRFRAAGMGDAWEQLLKPFGLQPVPDLVLDANAGAVPVPVAGAGGSAWRQVDAPFHLRNLPAFRDFRPFRTPARGGLSFIAASPLRVDPERVAEAGYEAVVTATTTENARVRPLPDGDFGPDDLASGLPVPKQNLMVLLTPRDPWAGQLLVLASASPLRDGIIGQAGYGHGVFLRDLARTFADPERLVRVRVDRARPPALPALSGAARLGWRVAAVAFVPLVWLVVAARRLGGLARARGGPRGASAAPTALRPGLVAGACLAALVAIGTWRPLAGLRLDLTAARLHTSAPEVVAALAARAADLRAELVASPPSQLPASVRAAVDRAVRLLDDAGLPLRRVHPGAQGAGVVPPFDVERVRRDTSVTAQVYCGLQLRGRDGATAVIPRLDARTGRHLDFLVAAGLRRLEAGRAPVVAVISDLPRLSPAESLEDYQKKGLSAPQGVDVYSRAKELLGDYGYDVRHVSLREPAFPEDPAAVVWFQPRRDSTPILTQLAAHLAAGGHAVVACQHFNIQQRQYRGTGFETVHWPQPQFQDLDRYLQLVGVEQVREVLMDRTGYHLELDTQVNRTAVREYDPQQVALPFLIRAVGASYAAGDPVAGGLGDLLFIWGNRFALDAAKMAAAPVRARVLVTTTARAWSYDWSGGWLPPEAFQGATYLPGPQPLVVALEGSFPAVTAVSAPDGGTRLEPLPALPGPEGAPGRQGSLLLIGSSEMFKNEFLLRAGFAHEQLLLNAVADAVYGPSMAALQGRHAAAAPGFAVQAPGARTAWRLAVIGLGPALLGLAAAWRLRRSPGHP